MINVLMIIVLALAQLAAPARWARRKSSTSRGWRGPAW